MNRKWAIIIAIILGLLAVFLTNLYLSQQQQQQKTEEVAVLAAAKDIVKGSTVDYEMLAIKVVPTEFVQPGVLRAREQAVGKTAIATILAGEQVLGTKLAAPGAGLTLAGKTPAGKRAFTIGLEAASAVGGMLRPSDHVDVLAVFSNPPIIVTLFQDILILAVGREMVPEEEPTRGREEAASLARARETVTLALSPQEVQVLTVAMEQGKIRLTLRPQMEKGLAMPPVDLSNLPPAIDLGTLLQYYIRRVEPPPSVEVIRGLKKEVTPLPTDKEW